MLKALTAIRRELHKRGELSGQEKETAKFVATTLAQSNPAKLITGVGGHGVCAVFSGNSSGQTVLLRGDLDALPIDETLAISHASRSPGVAHKCGHDGHMAILIGVAQRLSQTPLKQGKVVLLFQPAEENGQGAQRVLEDPRFTALTPTRAVALHNLPGFEEGQIVLRRGVFASASVALRMVLVGATSHASEPHQGRSPALELAHLIASLSSLPQFASGLEEAAQATVVHARLGEMALGTSPGTAELTVTLRAHDDAVLERLKRRALALGEGVALGAGLRFEHQWLEPFIATTNNDETVSETENLCRQNGWPVASPPHPFPWSEDFGLFLQRFPGLLFGLGSGESCPALHHPTYDFPDSILLRGVDVMEGLARAFASGKGG